MNALDIKKRRKELKLTQQKLADLIGVSLKTVSNYENDGIIPESKKALLHRILYDNEVALLHEVPEIYVKKTGYEEKISNLEDLIKEHEAIIDLVKDNDIKINHHTEMIKLLHTQIDIIKEAKTNHE